MADIREAANRVIDEGLAEFNRILSSEGWEDLGQTEEVRRFKKQEGDRVFVKAVGVINFLPSDIADFIANLENRHKFIHDLESINILHDYPDVKVAYETLKLPWPVSNRDTVFAIKKLNQGEDIMVITKSIEVGHPAVHNYVRAEMVVIAYHLRNIEDVATEVTYVGCADPKGHIPLLVINALAGSHCLGISKIRKAMNQTS